ncbi:hypothetical protein LTR97_001823 [Elasticomyces elasticus]|uniref:Uncharacterized protein n=1 Tax=Elasticomyces elasticus TaxID=574655 RepID=A0AAN7WIF8_9PEZI|nr:hypothetical protein LTR97_001823 [Elasticomyces elasticus]
MATLGACVPSLSLILRTAKDTTEQFCDLIKQSTSDGDRLQLACPPVLLAYSSVTFNQALTDPQLAAAIGPDRFPGYAQPSMESLAVRRTLADLISVRHKLATFLERTKRLRPSSYALIPCVATARGGARTICLDHMHDEAGLLWPKYDDTIEMRHLSPTTSTRAIITRRDFGYEIIRPQPVTGYALHSAIDAMQRTIAMDAHWPYPATISLGEEECATAERISHSFRTLPDLLASVGFYAWLHYKRSVRDFHLGIILPGTVEIFWPNGRSAFPAATRRTVYVQAEHVCKDGNLTYRFLGVKSVEYNNTTTRSTQGQTAQFLDLPAEVRNQIYGYYLDAQPAVAMPKRQPAMSLTCRQVNKELLGLVFKKHGWIVYG